MRKNSKKYFGENMPNKFKRMMKKMLKAKLFMTYMLKLPCFHYSGNKKQIKET